MHLPQMSTKELSKKPKMSACFHSAYTKIGKKPKMNKKLGQCNRLYKKQAFVINHSLIILSLRLAFFFSQVLHMKLKIFMHSLAMMVTVDIKMFEEEVNEFSDYKIYPEELFDLVFP